MHRVKEKTTGKKNHHKIQKALRWWTLPSGSARWRAVSDKQETSVSALQAWPALWWAGGEGAKERKGSLRLALLSGSGAEEIGYTPPPQRIALGGDNASEIWQPHSPRRALSLWLGTHQCLLSKSRTRKPSWPLGHLWEEWVHKPGPHLELASCAGLARFYMFVSQPIAQL